MTLSFTNLINANECSLPKLILHHSKIFSYTIKIGYNSSLPAPKQVVKSQAHFICNKSCDSLWTGNVVTLPNIEPMTSCTSVQCSTAKPEVQTLGSGA